MSTETSLIAGEALPRMTPFCAKEPWGEPLPIADILAEVRHRAYLVAGTKTSRAFNQAADLVEGSARLAEELRLIQEALASTLGYLSVVMGRPLPDGDTWQCQRDLRALREFREQAHSGSNASVPPP